LKKIIFICMALVMALGALGIGYASWFDTVAIKGTVNTGSVDLNVTRVDGDNVWKNLDTGTLVYDHWIWDYIKGDYIDYPVGPENGYLVAWSTAYMPSDDVVIWSYNNLFPFTGGWGGFIASARMVYAGTVPVHLELTSYLTVIPESWVTWQYFVYEYEGGSLIESGTGLEGLAGQQLHKDNIVSVQAIIRVPQYETEAENEANMNLNGTIGLTIVARQWNE